MDPRDVIFVCPDCGYRSQPMTGRPSEVIRYIDELDEALVVFRVWRNMKDLKGFADVLLRGL